MNTELRKLRGDKKLSEVALANGISLQYLSKLELGKKTPGFSTALRLSKYYGIPIEELFLDLFENRDMKEGETDGIYDSGNNQ